MKSMKVVSIFILSVLFILSSINGSLGASCTGFKEFTLFPNPIQVGQTAHLRVVAPLPGLQGTVTDGSIMVSVKFNGNNALQLANIPLCDSTPSIVCSSLGAGDNALSFEFDVPQIPIGTYAINVSVTVAGITLCNEVSLQVTDPRQTNKNQFYSYIRAQLAGTAQFENSNVYYRAVGDVVQIGPIGYIPAVYADHYEWGSFLSLNGTEDVLSKQFEINSHYVWGIHGNLTQIDYSSSVRNHTYTGTFYAGYVNQRNQTKLDLEILTGEFSLTWSYIDGDMGSTLSTLSGFIDFDDDAGTIPVGWSSPITLVKYGTLYIETDSRGLLLASANKTYCLTSDNCPKQPEQLVNGNTSSSGLSDKDIILIVCLTVGTAILVSIIVMMALYLRRRKKFEEEDGIFSSTRKPEYGNALVVDDIIQEVREHGNSPMIPPLDRHPNDMDDDYSDDMSEDESELSDHRRESRFSRDVGGPSSPNRGRERDSGRYGKRSRSNSVESAPRRSMSPRRRDDDSSYYSDAGSSASRASLEDD